MTDFQTISNLIVTKLQGISGLNGVYNYEPDKPTAGQYPFATVTPVSFEGEFADTVRNKRTYVFSVRVYQERMEAGFGNSKAERLVREMSDEILTAFDSDTTLSGALLYVKPAHGDLTYENRELGDTRVIEITFDCLKMVNSS